LKNKIRPQNKIGLRSNARFDKKRLAYQKQHFNIYGSASLCDHMSDKLRQQSFDAIICERLLFIILPITIDMIAENLSVFCTLLF